MRFKVDENLPTDVVQLLKDRGNDAHSVNDEQLCGQPDSVISTVCRNESRILLTLDVDFANVVAYPPQDYVGIIVLRTSDQSKPAVQSLVVSALHALESHDITRCLWVVEPGRIRVRSGS